MNLFPVCALLLRNIHTAFFFFAVFGYMPEFIAFEALANLQRGVI
jgi:hypothetical protein